MLWKHVSRRDKMCQQLGLVVFIYCVVSDSWIADKVRIVDTNRGCRV